MLETALTGKIGFHTRPAARLRYVLQLPGLATTLPEAGEQAGLTGQASQLGGAALFEFPAGNAGRWHEYHRRLRAIERLFHHFREQRRERRRNLRDQPGAGCDREADVIEWLGAQAARRGR